MQILIVFCIPKIYCCNIMYCPLSTLPKTCLGHILSVVMHRLTKFELRAKLHQSKSGLSSPDLHHSIVFLLTIPRWFLCCSFSLFVYGGFIYCICFVIMCSSFLLSVPHIMKTCLYNFDPLEPHFYIVKLRFTGVDIIFLISVHKNRLWVLIRTASLRQF